MIATKICGYNERFTWFREDGSGTRVTRDQVTRARARVRVRVRARPKELTNPPPTPQIIESVEGSLKRLGVDHIDLLQAPMT